MTEEQKKQRIALIEQDVQQIMHKLYDIDRRVDMDLQRKPDYMEFEFPSIKIPTYFKKIWIGFLRTIQQ